MIAALIALLLGLISISAVLWLVTKQEAAMKCVCGDAISYHNGPDGSCTAVHAPHRDDDFGVSWVCGCPGFTTPKIVSRRA